MIVSTSARSCSESDRYKFITLGLIFFNMSDSHIIRTARLTDRQVIELVYSIKEGVANDEVSINNITVKMTSNLPVDITNFERNDETVKRLDKDRHAISEVSISLGGVLRSVMFLRGIRTQGHNQPSPYFDEIEVLVRDIAPQDVGSYLEFIDIIENVLPQTYPTHESNNPQSPADFLQAMTSTLTDKVSGMLNDLVETRIEFEAGFKERHEKLEIHHQAALDQLEIQDKKRKQAFHEEKSRKEKALQEKEEKLEMRAQELDDREHKHARRDLREQITENFERRLAEPVIPRRTSKIRWAVFGLTLIVGLALGWLGFDTLGKTQSPGNSFTWPEISLLVRGVLSIFLAVGFVAYAVNWLKAFYLDDVRTGRRYESYRHDIDRASFIIETILEVGEKEKIPVPDAWIEGVCRNLFTEAGETRHGNVPDNVAEMLLQSVTGAKFGPEGTEVTVEKRSGWGGKKFSKGK